MSVPASVPKRSGRHLLHRFGQPGIRNWESYSSNSTTSPILAPAVIRTLLDLGGNLEAKDAAGNTPLHLAAWFNDTPAVIEALLEAGANRDARDRFGRTPWDYAQDRIALAESSGDLPLARQLRQAFEVN